VGEVCLVVSFYSSFQFCLVFFHLAFCSSNFGTVLCDQSISPSNAAF
jgi:hypothetical protein